jgi:hypothetical protein
VRRARPARKRSGASELPALASDRTRARTAGVAMVTMLRRAPREVYRVYDEEEFLADAPYDERADASHVGAGEPRLKRLATVTLLLAAVGALGGLVVLAGASSVARGRRRGARTSAAAARLVPGGTRRRRERVSSRVHGRLIVGARPTRLVRSPHRTGRHTRILAAPRPRGTGMIDVAVSASGAGLVNATARVSVADLRASASAVRLPQQRVEFGFER